MNKDLFAREALAQIPKLLTLLDRNPHSPTYGCFDRNFWQYKIIDFPSGMAQEFVWPLALVYNTPLPDNHFYQQPALRDWIEAGILYAASSAHPDGSCDDYFPFERAGGAAAFSLLACIESYQELGLNNFRALKFFEKRADWLAHHHESGRLTNHQALIVLCLELLTNLLQTNKWDRARVQRLERVLSWQNPEGWFIEYEGCDPGYHTLTISCLARIYQLHPDPRLQEALIKAVQLAAEFVHPDGSYGGEYTSRNTYNFFPHGFELVGKWFPEALEINDRILAGLDKGLGSCYADDHIIGHHTWNYLLAWRDFVENRPPIKPRPQGRVYLKEAKILIDRREDSELYLALNKGGVFKIFRDRQLVVSDTQFSLQVKGGSKVKNAIAHLVDSYSVKVGEYRVSIEGNLGWAKQKQMTSLNLMILRIVMFTIGRFFPNLIRKILQTVLITGKKDAPFKFRRSLEWHEGQWCVSDELKAKSWQGVIQVGIGGDQTSIYVVMSRTFQQGQLQPWLDLTGEVKKLNHGDVLKLDRNF
ncbi:MAG TPA: hypothetical protein DEG17_13590 [Cyanobacteria bacterium UBA11149]|nr:hypothetical protein [Cyanobacteria bacterium UBA11367]HBE58066.1 hypothetical protein [Cyanobacteria bacterium UBA11366]HBR74961.1 hypothetical protein [Cyanobacteria bacterium UBA11159]HBS71503.1 hypothetical protein [Cyanobacteria bacterium UBA11153]HBW89875.1 hypothetical protein [Cyanobacteria bacterium UBA11149]HCA94819.1 hypothetical protein [Cyanobacteria bacterium UBA9226]